MSNFHKIIKKIFIIILTSIRNSVTGGLTINHSHTQLEHYFLHLNPVQAVSLCQTLLPPYITATHKTVYLSVALTNSTKQQDTLTYTEQVSTYVISQYAVWDRTAKNVCNSPLLLAPDRRIVYCCDLCYTRWRSTGGKYSVAKYRYGIINCMTGVCDTVQTEVGFR
jgi:hypothetical protein